VPKDDPWCEVAPRTPGSRRCLSLFLVGAPGRAPSRGEDACHVAVMGTRREQFRVKRPVPKDDPHGV
jgi:hypothetical protein